MIADRFTINSHSYSAINNLNNLPASLNPANLATRIEGVLQLSQAFSNFHKSHFTIDRVKYTCAEQQIQEKKAIIFGDGAAASKFMGSNTAQQMKALRKTITLKKLSGWTIYSHNC